MLPELNGFDYTARVSIQQRITWSWAVPWSARESVIGKVIYLLAGVVNQSMRELEIDRFELTLLPVRT